jgi:hypothetical protein
MYIWTMMGALVSGSIAPLLAVTRRGPAVTASIDPNGLWLGWAAVIMAAAPEANLRQIRLQGVARTDRPAHIAVTRDSLKVSAPWIELFGAPLQVTAPTSGLRAEGARALPFSDRQREPRLQCPGL